MSDITANNLQLSSPLYKDVDDSFPRLRFNRILEAKSPYFEVVLRGSHRDIGQLHSYEYVLVNGIGCRVTEWLSDVEVRARVLPGLTAGADLRVRAIVCQNLDKENT